MDRIASEKEMSTVEKDFHWIHTFTQNKTEMAEIAKQFDLPEYVLESASDPNEVSRREHWDKNHSQIPDLLILKYPHKITGQLGHAEYRTLPLTILTLENKVLTFSQSEVHFLTDAFDDSVFSKETWDRDYFILSLIWRIGAEYINCLNDVNDRMNRLESHLTVSTQSDALFDLMALQKSLVYFDSAIDSNHPVINELQGLEFFTEAQRSRSLLHQALIEIEQAERMVSETNQLLGQISDVFSSAIGNNLNTVVKFLSSITIILSIPSIIGALWGMNVPVPLTHHPFGFFILGIFSILLTVLSVWYFYKKNYL